MELESARLKRKWEEQSHKLKELKGPSIGFFSTKTGWEAEREQEERQARENAFQDQELLVQVCKQAYLDALKAEVTNTKRENATAETGVKHLPEKEPRKRGDMAAEFQRGIAELKLTTANDMKKSHALLTWMQDHKYSMSPDTLRVYVRRYVPPPK